MTVASYAYGTSADVAAYVGRFATAAGDFDTTTYPTKTRVEGMVNRVSSIINAMLADLGFTVPLTTAQGVNAMTEIVMQYSAELVEGINGSNRFAPGSKAIAGRNSTWTIISDEIYALLDRMTHGLEEMGETRTDPTVGGVAYRDTDNAGKDTFPLFQRKEFGNVYTDWDPD